MLEVPSVSKEVPDLIGRLSDKAARKVREGPFDQDYDIPHTTVHCGPGSIAQAHKPDEFISLERLGHRKRFMSRLLDRVSAR